MDKFTFKSDQDTKGVITSSREGVSIKTYAKDDEGWILSNQILIPGPMFQALTEYIRKNADAVVTSIEKNK